MRVDELEIRRAVRARYKARCREVRALIAECGRLKAQVAELEFLAVEQRRLVELAEQVLGLRDAPPAAAAP
jgi:hypothetical protein